MLLPNLVQVTESISGSVVPLAMFLYFFLKMFRFSAEQTGFPEKNQVTDYLHGSHVRKGRNQAGPKGCHLEVRAQRA